MEEVWDAFKQAIYRARVLCVPMRKKQKSQLTTTMVEWRPEMRGDIVVISEVSQAHQEQCMGIVNMYINGILQTITFGQCSAERV